MRRQLWVPARLFRILTDLGVRTSEDFAEYVQTFPSAFANPLGWTLAQVEEAVKLLRDVLVAAEPGARALFRAGPKRAHGARFV